MLGPLDHFSFCLFLLLVLFLGKLKLFTLLGCSWSWWIPLQLMVAHADPLMGALKYNLLAYFLFLAHAQFYNQNHVDIINFITQSTLPPWTVKCQILSWVPKDLFPQSILKPWMSMKQCMSNEQAGRPLLPLCSSENASTWVEYKLYFLRFQGNCHTWQSF